MKSLKNVCILIITVTGFCAYSCKTEEILLHGDISGYVTDTETSQPVKAAKVILDPVNDTAITAIDGKYTFTSLIPGNYVIETSVAPYAKVIRNCKVASANTTEIDFALHKIPYPKFSERHLDFGFDATLKSFTITNTGTGKLNYSLTTTQDWITVYPNIGEITTGTDTIKVAIDKTGLSDRKHIESIEIVSHAGEDLVRDTIGIYLNGIMDMDHHYYGIVKIGTQIWMAENLNTGVQISNLAPATNNKNIEKYCYDDNKDNCSIYGGLYTWEEMMDYNASDNAITGTTQGICPVGWHIPTPTEWTNFVITIPDSAFLNGGKLKEKGTAHWNSPNTNATNESGFSALPGGVMIDFKYWDTTKRFDYLGYKGLFWASQALFFDIPGDPTLGKGADFILYYDSSFIDSGLLDATETRLTKNEAISVRCIKDPPKK
jgi:uncharacterized protein (TIGR02145 family)